nr:sulfite exporter TauE/SafE family protein [Motiliproteus sp. SC1-56]
METWQLFVLSLVGLLAGWLNVMAGGGSLLTLPVMLFMGLPAPVANGSNRIGILLQNISATLTFYRQGFSDFRLSLGLALFACLGALAGASLGVQLDGAWFDRLLALVMIGVLLLMLFAPPDTPRSETTDQAPGKRRWLAYLCMIAVGFWGGLIQIGVGFILMPVLNRVLGLDLVRVNMHKVFIVAAYTLVALGVFASQVEIDWYAGMALALGTMVGGWLGVHTNLAKGQTWIRRVLVITLVAFIIKLLWSG